MTNHILDLRSFYASPLGYITRGLLRQAVGRMWPDMAGHTLLGVGYATPLLRPYLAQNANVLAVMPAAQGAAYWPKEAANRTVMGDPYNLPFADQSIDRIILLHALESIEASDQVLREAWRVLKGTGKILAIVANRRGLWARYDATPFGYGQPFSARQLQTSLVAQGFRLDRLHYALQVPPWSERVTMWLGNHGERVLGRVCPLLGGVIIAEASKQLYAPLWLQARPQRATAKLAGQLVYR